jgi:hypothetical protein
MGRLIALLILEQIVLEQIVLEQIVLEQIVLARIVLARIVLARTIQEQMNRKLFYRIKDPLAQVEEPLVTCWFYCLAG